MHSYSCRRTKCITFSFSGTTEAKESDDSLRDGNLQENSNADYENNLINFRKNPIIIYSFRNFFTTASRQRI